jgi:hypothetical protein
LYRIVLICEDVPRHLGAEAAVDITEEFTHRPWNRNVVCSWDGHSLLLEAESDIDSDGLALRDEFSDAICAYVSGGFGGELRVQSVTKI